MEVVTVTLAHIFDVGLRPLRSQLHAKRYRCVKEAARKSHLWWQRLPLADAAKGLLLFVSCDLDSNKWQRLVKAHYIDSTRRLLKVMSGPETAFQTGQPREADGEILLLDLAKVVLGIRQQLNNRDFFFNPSSRHLDDLLKWHSKLPPYWLEDPPLDTQHPWLMTARDFHNIWFVWAIMFFFQARCANGPASERISQLPPCVLSDEGSVLSIMRSTWFLESHSFENAFGFALRLVSRLEPIWGERVRRELTFKKSFFLKFVLTAPDYEFLQSQKVLPNLRELWAGYTLIYLDKQSFGMSCAIQAIGEIIDSLESTLLGCPAPSSNRTIFELHPDDASRFTVVDDNNPQVEISDSSIDAIPVSYPNDIVRLSRST